MQLLRLAAPLWPDERSSVSWSMVKLLGASSSASQPVMAEAGDWATYRFSSGKGSTHLASRPMLLLSLSGTGCATPERVCVDYCEHARPIYFDSQAQVGATPAPIRRQVLEGNKVWRRLCDA